VRFIAPTHARMARLSGPQWHGGGNGRPAKGRHSTNRARRDVGFVDVTNAVTATPN